MTKNPSKLVLAMAVLLAVWVAVFWMYKPRTSEASAGGISYGDPPDLAKALVATDPIKSPQPTQVQPLPAAPLPGVPKPEAPTPPPSPAPLVKKLIAPEFTDYTVQKGDSTFAAVSKRLYGTSRHADAISRANPFVTPDKLIVGRTKLRIPKDPTNIQGRIEEVPGEQQDQTPSPRGEAPAVADATEHTVQPGETLGAISKHYYGTATRWKAILDANSDKLDKPEKLRAGMTLKIPPKD